MNDKDRIDVLLKIFDNQQSLISFADNKANISLGVQVFLITTVFGTSLISNTFSFLSNHSCFVSTLYYLLFAFFWASSLAGLTMCLLVFRPRPPQERSEAQRSGISYFGHIVKYKNSQGYFTAVSELDQSDLLKEFAFQNYTLAKILDHKMRYVKRSIIFLFVDIFIGVSLFLFAIVIR